MIVNKSCPVCSSLMNKGIQDWHWVCAKCGYENADFEPAINEASAHQQIDERLREKGLQSLRIENFNKLLESIANDVPAGRLLHVGCAHGWFLEAAQNRGFEAIGIEPDLNVFSATARRGLTVRKGYFPEVLAENEKFDVIVFNDVFEHIPNIISVLEGCKKHLRPKGVLVLNLPSSSGLFYKAAKFLSKVGISSFFERLWQKGLPSPHLHYFNAMNLQSLLQNNGFEEIAKGQLSTLKLNGLFTRISYTKEHILPVRLLILFLVAFAFPLTKLMPSDIIYSVSRKKS